MALLPPSLLGSVLSNPTVFLANRANAALNANAAYRNLSAKVGRAQNYFHQIQDALAAIPNVTGARKEEFFEVASPYSREEVFRDKTFNLNDPLTAYQWFAIIPGVLEQGEYIQSITTPSLRYDEQTKFRDGKMHHYAGFFSVDDISMTLYTEISGYSTSLASKWLRNVRGADGMYGMPSQYKKTVLVSILDQNDGIIAGFKYSGCWPKSWDSYTLDYSSSTILATVVQLSVDDVEFTSNPF